MLPSPNAEFIEQRNRVTLLNRGKKRPIWRIQLLVAMSTRPGICNYLACFIQPIRVTRIYLSKICQQRNQSTLTLIYSIANSVGTIYFSPGENPRWLNATEVVQLQITNFRIFKPGVQIEFPHRQYLLTGI